MIKELKRDWYKILLFTIAIILAGINFNLLLKPVNVAAGGAGGLALVLSNVFHISTSNLILIIYIITVILSILFLDKKTLASIIYASILYPIVTYLTEDITSIISLNYSDVFLICVVSGVISGFTNGIAFRYGYAPGGISVISPIFHKYFKAIFAKLFAVPSNNNSIVLQQFFCCNLNVFVSQRKIHFIKFFKQFY